MDAHNNGNEQQQTIQATKGNGNLKGGIPMNPVMQTKSRGAVRDAVGH